MLMTREQSPLAAPDLSSKSGLNSESLDMVLVLQAQEQAAGTIQLLLLVHTMCKHREVCRM